MRSRSFWWRESRIGMCKPKKNLNNLERPDNPGNQVMFGLVGLGLVWFSLVRCRQRWAKSSYHDFKIKIKSPK